MTRINTIPVEDLLDEWLIAEYRELKRIPNKMREGGYKCDWIPEDYRMGFGHERFFLDKQLYLKNRHDSIVLEMTTRFHNDYPIRVTLDGIDEKYLGDWTPSMVDHSINVGRLYERFRLRKRDYHLRGAVVTEQMFDGIYGKYLDQ